MVCYYSPGKPERPYHLLSEWFHPVGMHIRAGTWAGARIQVGSSTAHPYHVAHPPHAPLSCRGVSRCAPPGGGGWCYRARGRGIVSGWASGGCGLGVCVRPGRTCARVSACPLCRRRLSRGPRALVARVAPFVSAANDALDGGRSNHDRFAFRSPAVPFLQIDHPALRGPRLAPPLGLVVLSLTLPSCCPIWPCFRL